MNLAVIALRLGASLHARIIWRSGPPAAPSATLHSRGSWRHSVADLARFGVKARRQNPLPHDQLGRVRSRVSGVRLARRDPGATKLSIRPKRAGAHRRGLASRHSFCWRKTCVTIRRLRGLRPGVARMIVTGQGLASTTGEKPPSASTLALAPFDADSRRTGLHRVHLRHHRQAEGRRPRPSLARSAWATATAPACRRSRATSSSPPANGASSAHSATTCCSRFATAPQARSWRTAPRRSASCRPSSATASRCCIRSRRSTGASWRRPASSNATISPRSRRQLHRRAARGFCPQRMAGPLRLPDLGALRHLGSADGDRRRPGHPKRGRLHRQDLGCARRNP